MASRIVTLVLHGTFASEEAWWRIGQDGEATFADRLEEQLASHGMPGTVGEPLAAAGMSEDDFAWSGENRHHDRIHGARALTRKLEKLAGELHATESDPLEVNLVAHSHGGNVALEMLKRLPDNVRARRVVMLGTPLMWRRAAVDLYPIVASLFVFLGLVGSYFAGVLAPEPGELPMSATEFWLVTVISLVVLAVLLGPYLLLIERPFVWSENILAWVVSLFRKGGTSGRPAYGPRPEDLASLVKKPPLLLTSREDEADLALHIGASPREVYGALVKGRMKGMWRLVELLWLRGVFSVVVAPIAEAITEHYVLGFRWSNVLFNDYEMVNFQSEDDEYAGKAIRRVNLSDELVPALKEKLASWTPSAPLLAEDTEGQSEKDRHIQALGSTIRGVWTDIKNQTQLRHTVYYQSDVVIERVAAELVS